MIARLHNWFVESTLANRRAVVATLVLLTVGLGSQIPKIQADFTPEDVFARFEEEKQFAADFKATFGNTDSILVLLVEADDVVATAPLQYLHTASLELRKLDSVQATASISVIPFARRASPSINQDFSLGSILKSIASGELKVGAIVSGNDVTDDESAALRDALADAPLIKGKLLARDGTLAVVAVVLKPEVSRSEHVELAIRELEQFVDSHAPPPGVKVTLGGLPYMRASLIRKMRRDQTVLMPTAIIVCLLMLFITFRWWPAVILPVLAVGMAAAILVGCMALYGEAFNIINNIVPLLVIIVGISNAIHIVNRFGEELVRGHDRLEASKRSLRAMVVACFLTSFTTAVGFASLAVSETTILRRFGVTASIGVMIAYVALVTFLPVALSWVKEPKQPIAHPEEGFIERVTGPLATTLIRIRVAVLIGAVALLAGAVWLARDTKVDSSILDQFDESDVIYKTALLLEDKLDGVRPLELNLQGSAEGAFDDPELLNAMHRIKLWAATQPGVLSSTSYADFLHETWYIATGDINRRVSAFDGAERIKALRAFLDASPQNPSKVFVTPDRNRARLNVQLGNVGTRASIELISRLEGQVKKELEPFPDVQFRFTGEGYIGSQGVEGITNDLVNSLMLAIVVIFAIMTLLFRDLRVGLVSVPPTALPLVATMAYMRLRGIPLNTASAVIFAISIGMAVDGTIHLLARFVEEIRSGIDRDLALVRSARGTGKAIIVSYVGLVIGFSVFQVSEFLPVRRFGELVAVTIFGCLLATLIILPALMSLMWRRGSRASRERDGRAHQA